jgi:hypothetical protein
LVPFCAYLCYTESNALQSEQQNLLRAKKVLKGYFKMVHYLVFLKCELKINFYNGLKSFFQRIEQIRREDWWSSDESEEKKLFSPNEIEIEKKVILSGKNLEVDYFC